MTKTTSLLLLFLCLFSMSNEALATPNYSEDEVIIQFTEDATETEIAAFLDQYNLIIIDGPTPILEFYLAKIDPDLGWPGGIEYNNYIDPVNGVIITAQTSTEVKSIGLNYFVFSPQVTGPKPSITGSGGLSPLFLCNNLNYSINTPALGSHEINAAIFDTGIINHPFFSRYFPEDGLGINYVDDNLNPIDDHGHGTHITSSMILDLPTFFGLDDPINLVSYKTHDKNGLGVLWDLIQGIDRVIEDDLKVANFSLSYSTSYEHRNDEYAPLRVAITAAKDMTGTLFVAAAGNDGLDIDDPANDSNYPAAFPQENIIGVTAVDCFEKLPRWANYGTTSVDIAAPGVNILGLNHEGEYQTMDGTSSAAAIITRFVLQLATLQEHFSYSLTKCVILNSVQITSNLEAFVVSQGYAHAEDAFFNLLDPVACMSSQLEYAPSQPIFTPSNQSADVQLSGNVLNIQSATDQLATITTFNSLGQVLSTQKVSLYKGDTRVELDWSTQNSPAMYLINVQYGQKSKTLKLIR